MNRTIVTLTLVAASGTRIECGRVWGLGLGRGSAALDARARRPGPHTGG